MLPTLLLAVSSLSPVPTGVPPASGEEFLTWRGRAQSLAAAAGELGAAAVEELRNWSEWCAAQGYQAVLDDDGRALIVASSDRRDFEKLAARALEAAALVEALTPAPERDPEETFLVPEWGLGQHVPERDTATVVLVEEEDDFTSLLELLESMKPFLAGHLPGRATVPAFHSGAASTGALLSTPRDIEIGTVWRTHNEVVNRLARLLLHRRFGELPHWLEMGLAWHVEQTVMGDLYSFPGRDEFVSVHDHDGWKNDLKREFRKRRKEPLRLDEVAGWSAQRWNPHCAAIAWGFGKFLAGQSPETVSAILEDLRLDMKEHGVEVHPDGSWQMVPAYTTPVERQHEILTRHLGDDYLGRVSEFFRKWKL
jgi:hypothetical protein